MAISTKGKKTLTTEEKKKKTAELREYHQAYFESIGEPEARYIAKVRYGYGDFERSKWFESDINNSRPLYVEWVSKDDYSPEDSRRLYKYEYNPYYKEDYKLVTTSDGRYEMYEIPADKFVLVRDGESFLVKTSPSDATQSLLEMDFDIINPDEDCPMENMTARDWAAILLKSPVSRKEWLNKLINQACQK